MRAMGMWFLCCCLLTGIVHGQSPILKKGDRLAIVGDSITEQKQYSKFIEAYLQACYPQLELQTFQFGWGGEQAVGFAARMDNDLVPWKPTVVTTCYGMNDGGYRAFEASIGQNYENGMRRIVERLKGLGATVVVGSPGVVDSYTWQVNKPEFDQVYNDNLQRLGQIGKQLANDHGFPFADVFEVMQRSMVAAKAALGEKYPVAGGDGVHPDANGHLLMAYAFLKTMGLDGDIGTISVDLRSGQWSGSAGHRVLSSQGGAAEIESTRYPFCFLGNSSDPNGTVSILPFVAFNQDLNRLLLRVSHLETAEAEVTFGEVTKAFSRDQLAQGVLLAAEFLENPFVVPFHKVLDEVGRKQAQETLYIKGLITNFRMLRPPLGDDPEVQAAMATLRRKMFEADDGAHATVRAAVQPVRFHLVVKPKPIAGSAK